MPNFTLTPATIRDAQSRLTRLGHDTSADSAGVIGAATSVALQAFQRQRGLPISGQLDSLTMARLIEAGWSLGSRLLYYVEPHLRGDDVADLQESLALLGFNPGRIDGIFGHQTEHSLRDFQRNCGIPLTGELNRETLDQLDRMAHPTSGRRPVTEARDHAAPITPGRARLVVLHGEGTIARELSTRLSTEIEISREPGEGVHETATRANALNAALVIAVEEGLDIPGLELHYFESYRSHSVAGRQLSAAVAHSLSTLGTVPIRVSGMSLPILRETSMPAILVLLGSAHTHEGPRVAQAIGEATLDLFDRSR